MPFNLAFWQKPPEKATVDVGEGALGEAVGRMVQARMAILKATFLARSEYLKAQSLMTDSMDLKKELTARAAELDFVVGEIGG